jgi:hypothetical protein
MRVANTINSQKTEDRDITDKLPQMLWATTKVPRMQSQIFYFHTGKILCELLSFPNAWLKNVGAAYTRVNTVCMIWFFGRLKQWCLLSAKHCRKKLIYVSTPVILAWGFAPNYCMSGQSNCHSLTSIVLVSVSMSVSVRMFVCVSASSVTWNAFINVTLY